MKRLMASVAVGVMIPSVMLAKASERYLRHPFFKSLPEMEIRIETQFGYGDTGDMPFGLLGSFGVGIGYAWTVGAYGQVQTSDRDLPEKAATVFGVGGFAEYAYDFGSAVVPYAGIRLGILDPTGPTAPTLPYAGGYAGAKYQLTKTISLSAAVTLHVAAERNGFKAYNYKRNGYLYSADATDITFDAGLRYAF